MRNLLGRVSKTNKPVVSAVVKTVFAETDRDQAHPRWREVADSLRDRFRDVAELMDGEGGKRSLRGSDRRPNEHDVLAYMAFDESLRAKLHSTNPLERVNKEIKRRIRHCRLNRVWMAPAGQGLCSGQASGRSRPCVRRRSCSTMAARPDEPKVREAKSAGDEPSAAIRPRATANVQINGAHSMVRRSELG